MKKPPKTLQADGVKFWKDVLREFDLTDAHQLVLLERSGRCLDVAAAARKQIDADGEYITNRFDEVKPHPALEVEQSSTRLLRSLLRELGLGVASDSQEYTRSPSLSKFGPGKQRVG